MHLADREKAFRFHIEQMGSRHPELARQLVAFAWACLQKTTLARLRGRSRLQNALLMVQCWLKGESVEQFLRSMHDDVFEAALGAGRFEPDMTGQKAACWSVFELYQAALAVVTGERLLVARKAAWAASLAGRSGDDGLTLSVLEYQEGLFAEMFTAAPVAAVVDAV